MRAYRAPAELGCLGAPGGAPRLEDLPGCAASRLSGGGEPTGEALAQRAQGSWSS